MLMFKIVPNADAEEEDEKQDSDDEDDSFYGLHHI